LVAIPTRISSRVMLVPEFLKSAHSEEAQFQEESQHSGELFEVCS
jgi:hypothetical protein